MRDPGKGGKEETSENWTEVLKELDHVLGEDGEFVMECELSFFSFKSAVPEILLQTRIF